MTLQTVARAFSIVVSMLMLAFGLKLDSKGERLVIFSRVIGLVLVLDLHIRFIYSLEYNWCADFAGTHPDVHEPGESVRFPHLMNGNPIRRQAKGGCQAN